MRGELGSPGCRPVQSEAEPERPRALLLARQVVAGTSHTCALLRSGDVKCWGANSSLQLGIGPGASEGCLAADLADALAPVDFGAGRKATRLSAQGNTTCAIRTDNSVICWGAGGNGQLGRGETQNQWTANGPGIALGLDPGSVPIDVVVGDGHACVLTSDGRAKCWGKNDMGQLGIEKNEDWGDSPSELGPAIGQTGLPYVMVQ